MNKVFLSGRVVKDVALKHFDQTRAAIVNVIAVKRYSKEQSDFIPFQIWGKLTEVFEKYVNKGDFVTIIGSLITTQYTNPSTGVTTYGYYVNVAEIEFAPKQTKEVFESGKPKVNNGETPHDAHTLPQSMEKNMENYGIADVNVQIGDGDLPF